MNHNTPNQERLDDATRRRLARLASRPVDTTRLEARLNEALESYKSSDPVSRSAPLRWWRPLSRIAAVVAVAGLIGLLLLPVGNSPAIASTADLARVHREVMAGESDLMPVTTFTQAAELIHRKWARAPKLPEPMVGQVTASCLHEVADRDVVCLKLEYKDQPITMIVGHSREVVCSAEHQQITRNGRTYFVHDREGVRMVMINHEDRWVCIMSGASIEDLTEVADGLVF